MILRLAVVSTVSACVGCASAPRSVHSAFSEPAPAAAAPTQYTQDTAALYAQSDLSASRRGPQKPQWSEGQALMQGYLGSSSYSKVEAGNGTIDGDEGDLDTLPVIGGGGQWKVGGERIDFGFEGLLSFSGAANAAAVAIGGGGAAVAVDVDLLIFELFGGPFASVFLGEKLRAYVSAGPLLQWANYDQDNGGVFIDDNGSGFGSGWYARTGLEFVLASHTLLGMGVRWSDTSVDLGGSLGDLDIEGFQWMVTVTQGL